MWNITYQLTIFFHIFETDIKIRLPYIQNQGSTQYVNLTTRPLSIELGQRWATHGNGTDS